MSLVKAFSFVTVHLWGAFPEVIGRTQCLYGSESQHTLWASPAQQHVKCGPQSPSYGKSPSAGRHSFREISANCMHSIFISTINHWIAWKACKICSWNFFFYSFMVLFKVWGQTAIILLVSFENLYFNCSSKPKVRTNCSQYTNTFLFTYYQIKLIVLLY